jgi:hypothetical protein
MNFYFFNITKMTNIRISRNALITLLIGQILSILLIFLDDSLYVRYISSYALFRMYIVVIASSLQIAFDIENELFFIIVNIIQVIGSVYLFLMAFFVFFTIPQTTIVIILGFIILLARLAEIYTSPVVEFE